MLFTGKQLKDHHKDFAQKFIQNANEHHHIPLRSLNMNEIPKLYCYSATIRDRSDISEIIGMEPEGKIGGKEKSEDASKIDGSLKNICGNPRKFTVIVGQVHFGKEAVSLNSLKRIIEKAKNRYIFCVLLATIPPEKKMNILEFLTIESGGVE